MSELIASIYRCSGKPYRSVSSHPSMLAHRSRSNHWKLFRPFARANKSKTMLKNLRSSQSTYRRTATFEYIGAPDYESARRLGVRFPIKRSDRLSAIPDLPV